MSQEDKDLLNEAPPDKNWKEKIADAAQDRIFFILKVLIIVTPQILTYNQI